VVAEEKAIEVAAATVVARWGVVVPMAIAVVAVTEAAVE
jgi:hypothetical protein